MFMGIAMHLAIPEKNNRLFWVKKFYELFGWSMNQIVSRSRVIASGEAIVGTFLRYNMPDSIMIYTPTMLERAQIYSGKHQDDPLAIIIPKKDYMGS